MIDWRRGGATGSIKSWVRKEVREQSRVNPVAQRNRYPLLHRYLRIIYAESSFAAFIMFYVGISFFVLAAEIASVRIAHKLLPTWHSTWSPTAAELLRTVPGYLIGAQVGLLSVISIALALVSLIAQRNDVSTDVQVYYHESLFFGVVASSLALITVLCVQLFWPAEFMLRQAAVAANNPSFRLTLLCFHVGWLCLNVIAILHFIGITFGFVQPSAKERLRELYTANVVVPADLTQRLRLALYRSAGEGIWTDAAPEQNAPTIVFGSNLGEPYDEELLSNFKSPACLKNVHVLLVHWVLRRWFKRCSASNGGTHETPAVLGQSTPAIWFTLSLDRSIRGPVTWCRRRGGVPLSKRERAVLRLAFRFSRTCDEN